MQEYAHQPTISDWTRSRIVPRVCHCGARMHERNDGPITVTGIREYECDGRPRHAVLVDLFGKHYPVKPEAVTR